MDRFIGYALRTARRFWFLLCLPAALLLGLVMGDGAKAIRETGWAVPLLVASILFVTGLTIDVRRLAWQSANLRAFALTLVSTYVVAPLAGYLLGRLWGPPGLSPASNGFLFLQALMIAASQSGTLAASIALTRIARGDQELALLLTLASNTLTALLTPWILNVSVGGIISFPVGQMIRQIALVVLAPVAAGIVARGVVGSIPGRVQRLLDVVPQAIILLFAYIGFAAASHHLGRDRILAARFLAACLCLHAFMLTWSYWTAMWSGLRNDARKAVLFCGSQKTMPNGIYVWERFFASNPYGAVPLALHQILQLAIGMLLAHWLQGRERRA